MHYITSQHEFTKTPEVPAIINKRQSYKALCKQGAAFYLLLNNKLFNLFAAREMTPSHRFPC